MSSSTITSEAVIYDDTPHGPIQGIALSGLRRFTVALPAAADDVIKIDLTARRIYVDAMTRSGRHDVWSAAAAGLAEVGASSASSSHRRQRSRHARLF